MLDVADEMSQSEWSEESEEEEGAGDGQEGQDGYGTDDPALDNLSITNENGLTDCEG